MLVIPGKPVRFCDGTSRREFLRVGGSAVFGMSLPRLLELQAHAADSVRPKGFGAAKSAIVLFLQGGPSHIDIWDPKPEAPSNVRGEFKPIKSNVPGLWLSEVMPQLAKQMDKCT